MSALDEQVTIGAPGQMTNDTPRRPIPPSWQVLHGMCDPNYDLDTELDAYLIDVSQARTAVNILRWTGILILINRREHVPAALVGITWGYVLTEFVIPQLLAP